MGKHIAPPWWITYFSKEGFACDAQGRRIGDGEQLELETYDIEPSDYEEAPDLIVNGALIECPEDIKVARLIAAAPDLLEALRDVLLAPGEGVRRDAAMSKARAAIAKAENGTGAEIVKPAGKVSTR